MFQAKATLMGLLLFAHPVSPISYAADIVFYANSNVAGISKLKTAWKSRSISLPTGRFTRSTSDAWISAPTGMGFSDVDCWASSGEIYDARLRMITDVRTDGNLYRPSDAQAATVSHYSGGQANYLQLKITPSQGFGERVGKPVNVLLTVVYKGTVRRSASNTMFVSCGNYTILSGTDTRGQNVTKTYRFPAKIGDSFIIAMNLRSYSSATQGSAYGWLELNMDAE